ncbi:MAG: hypoxanthine phosphoribosyltransferase [Verrucomicrobiota bacterium]
MSLPGKTLFSEAELQQKIRELGEHISQAYQNKPLTVVGLMNGSLFFMVDLLRHLPYQTQMECWRVSSYEGKESTGSLKGLDAIHGDYAGRHILIVDDIFDTGLTLSKVTAKLHSLNAESVESCVLLSKKRKRVAEMNPKWIGFEIEDLFVIGYGLDLDHQYRPLPMIRVLE